MYPQSLTGCLQGLSPSRLARSRCRSESRHKAERPTGAVSCRSRNPCEPESETLRPPPAHRPLSRHRSAAKPVRRRCQSPNRDCERDRPSFPVRRPLHRSRRADRTRTGRRRQTFAHRLRPQRSGRAWCRGRSADRYPRRLYRRLLAKRRYEVLESYWDAIGSS